MQWLADNANNGYFLLAFAAAMLAGVWWIQKQIVFLIGAGVALVVLAVFWLVIHNVPTTAMRMETDVKSLAQAMLAKDRDKAARYVADGFKYNRKDFEKWYATLEKQIAESDVDAIDVSKFAVKSHDGENASVDFVIEAKHKSKSLYTKECETKLTHSGDVWRLAKVSLHGAGGSKKSKKDDDD